LVAAGVLLAAVALLLLPARGTARVFIAQNTFTMKDPNQKNRFTVGCPGKVEPFGGGMQTTPPASDGEGIYPHSYERLGVQHAYHITEVLYDPSAGDTQAHDVTLQVACGKKHSKITPPHQTIFVQPGQTKTATATCPGKRALMGGGFQRTDFTATGGDYINESRATSPKTWSVTATGFGAFGGELTAIGYCLHSKKPLLQEVSSTTPVPPGQYATTVTPPCTGARKLVFGGFSSSPAGSTLMTDAGFDPSGGWSTGGFNSFGTGASMITALGYCIVP
jgi:hypothetical protein